MFPFCHVINYIMFLQIYPTYKKTKYQSKPHGWEDSWTSGKQTEEIQVPDPPSAAKQALVQLKSFTKAHQITFEYIQ